MPTPVSSLQRALFRSRVTDMFARAGVTVGGSAPHDLVVHDERFFARVARDGSLGFGDSYTDGWWDSPSVDQLVHKIALAPKGRSLGVKRYADKVKYRLTNLQSRARARQVVDAHYELGNDFFALWLGSAMQYSCAYWDGVADLESAQAAKLALVNAKLGAKPGERVLEIGCGWGGLAEYVARHSGAHVTAVNISPKQIAAARARTVGLPVDVIERDYRAIEGTWDKVVSVAMLEAVGKQNLRTYFEKVHEVLRDDGVFVLHSIGSDITRLHPDRWITTRIFPNGYIPSAAELTVAMEGLFAIEDWHSFGPDYDLTLMAWDERFVAAWPQIQALSPQFDERFYRMWRFYLLSCAGTFRSRAQQLWQLVLTKHRTGTRWARVLRR